MKRAELEYELPEGLIAQTPALQRDAARMLVVRGDHFEHGVVRDLPSALPPSLIVLNDTRVFPARLRGNKPTGGKVELLLLERIGDQGPTERWRALGRASKGLPVGTRIAIGELDAVVEALDGKEVVVQLTSSSTVSAAIERVGEVPLPPYVKRAPGADDRERYQTVYASQTGAVAAPTAGLHFTDAMLDALPRHGHRVARVTLHVGMGTFMPVEVEDLDAHPMHAERYVVPDETALAIDAARRDKMPVVAIGTTVVRTLESAAIEGRRVRAGAGETRLFIRPPYAMRVVDGMLTNFHLPGSTLLALVMAMIGVDRTRAVYAEAIAQRYRFFSYGDAMLIPP